MTAEDGIIKRQTVEVRDDCSKDVVTRKTTPADQTVTTYDRSSGTEVDTVRHTENGTDLTEPITEKGKIKRQAAERTEAGNLRTVEEEIVPLDQTAISYYASLGGATTTTRHSENSTDLVVPTPLKGTIYRQEADRTESGNLRTVEQAIVPTDQTVTTYDRSSGREIDTVRHTENAADLTEPVTEKGKIKRQSAERTEAGNLRTVEEEIVVIDQTATSEDASPAATATKVRHTENSSALVAPSAEKGKIKHQEAEPTEAGNLHTIEEEIVVVDQTAVSYEASKARTATKTRHTENATDLVAPSATKGTIVRQEADRTEAGCLRTIVEEIVVADQTATSYDVSSAGRQTRVRHSENATDLTSPTPLKGTIYRQEADRTEAGNLTTIEDTIVPADQTAVSYDHDYAAKATKTTHSENATDLTLPTREAGKIMRQAAERTEAGNLRTVEEVIEVYDLEGQVTVVAPDSTVLETKHSEGDAIVDTSALGGTVRTVSQVKTAAGKWETQDRVVTAVKQDSGWLDFSDIYGTSYVRHITHGSDADLADVESAFEAGESNSLSAGKDEFDLWTIHATREVSGDNRDTYYGPSEDYKEWTTYKREYRDDSTAQGGYKWRDITIYRRLYIGITVDGGSALHGAWANLKNPPSSYVAAGDCVEPHYVGRKGGWKYYKSILVCYVFSATWNDATGEDPDKSP
jgi:hypothetical protein